MIEFINDFLFVPQLKTIKFNMLFFGSIGIISVFMFGSCIYFYGEINLIGNICKGIAYISLFLFTLACSAYLSFKVKK